MPVASGGRAREIAGVALQILKDPIAAFVFEFGNFAGEKLFVLGGYNLSPGFILIRLNHYRPNLQIH